ncbi:MAG: TIM barrel protein [Kiritimatiellia bacterium]|nr:TIM barrel protein [Kiritimatiellia bacterium]
MDRVLGRRDFLAIATGSALAVGNAGAIEAIVRNGRQRMRLSLAAYSFRKYLQAREGTEGRIDLPGFIDYAATLDLDAVELTAYYFPKVPAADYLAALKRRCHLAGLDISGGAIGNNFTVEPGPALEKQHKYVRAWIDHYAALGAPVIRVFAGRPPKGVSEEEGVARAVKNLRIACEYAGQKGVMLAIENHDYLVELDRLVKVVQQVDSPWFGVNFDSGNVRAADPYEALKLIAPYAVNAQIKVDIPRQGGNGREATDLPRIIGILRDAGYSGYIVLEYEAKEDPYKAVPGYLAKLREAIG